MKLIIHLHIAPEDIGSAGIALLILNPSTRCGQGGVVSLGIYQLVPTQQKGG
jgi:hypothetical protein